MTTNETNKIIEEAASAVFTQNDDPNTFVSKEGVKFRLKPVNRMISAAAAMKLQKPKVPTVWNKDKERSEENPNHPDYVEALNEYKYRRGQIGVDIYISLGSVLIDRGPKPAISETEWSEQLGMFGLEVPASGPARYLAWVKYVALDDEDATEMMLKIIRCNGIVLDQEVTDAIDAFRGNSNGSADQGVSATENGGSGDRATGLVVVDKNGSGSGRS